MCVIVATYNSRVTLACALDSVRRQDCQDFEVWVVGDACTDGSHEVVEALGDPRFHWINRETNSGSQSAPNAEGLRHARGRYVAYLGHDDLWFRGTSPRCSPRSSATAAFAHGLGVMLGPDEQLRSPVHHHAACRTASLRAADQLAASPRFSSASAAGKVRNASHGPSTRMRSADRRERRGHHLGLAAHDDQVSVEVVEGTRQARRVRSPPMRDELMRDPAACRRAPADRDRPGARADSLSDE